MGRMYFRELVLAAILLNLGRSVPAEDFQTNVVSGVSVDLTGFDYDVGVSGSFNYFEINGGGSQTNEDGVVGDRSTANHNFVVIKGANSVWENGGDLYVGNTGSVNQVTIQNGGQVAVAVPQEDGTMLTCASTAGTTAPGGGEAAATGTTTTTARTS